MLVFLSAQVVVDGASARSPARVAVGITTKTQSALLTTQRLNLTIRSSAPITGRVKAVVGGRTNLFSGARLRIRRPGSRRLLLLVKRAGRRELSICGDKKVVVVVGYRHRGRGGTSVARKRLSGSPARCPRPPGPPLARDDNPLTDEATARYVEVLANDLNPAGGALQIVSIDDSSTTGSASIAGSRIRYDPDGNFENLTEGETGSDLFSYTVEDRAGRRSSAAVNVEIDGVDDPASITATPPLYPAYSPEISDYAVRCDGNPVRMDVVAGPGNTVEVDDQGMAGGDFSTEVNLAANQAFTFARSAGRRQETHHVRCLPSDFPSWTFEKHAETRQQWYMVTPGDSYAVMFDGDGVPVWWFRDPTGPQDFKLLPDGSLAWATGHPGFSDRYETRDFDGNLLTTIRTVGNELDPHDLQLLPGGNFMAMTYRPRSEGTDLSGYGYGGPTDGLVYDAELQELTPDGDLVWAWNSAEHVGLEESGHWWNDYILNYGAAYGKYDVVHINSVDVSGDLVVISLRHTDGVYGIDRSTGEILWKLGGTPTPESLEVIGDPLGQDVLGGQHDARILADGTVTLHENGAARARSPRAVRFEINEIDRTATLLESLQDPAVPAALCCGSARRSPDGSWVVAWGGPGGGFHPVSEYSADRERTFTLSFPGVFTYRVHPVARGRVDVETLRRGMDAQHPR
jgi:hypothetical protein